MATQSKTQSDPAAMENRLEIVGQLAAGIAHEINTPVQYVGDNVRYVSDEIDTLLSLLNKYRELGSLIEGDTGLKSQFKELAEKEDLEFLIEEVPAALAQTIKGIESIAGIVRSLKSLVSSRRIRKSPDRCQCCRQSRRNFIPSRVEVLRRRRLETRKQPASSLVLSRRTQSGSN